jgi:hemoglobin-like flavoprotein
MTPQEISLVKTSFQKVEPIADQAAVLFYARLFELDPSLRMLFHGDMTERGRGLMHMVGLAVAGLDHLETVAPTIRQLGLRHVDHRVREEHYDTFGEALLWTLGKGLGAQFTADTRAAWAKVYWVLAETMKAGARDGAARMSRAVA